MPSVSIVMPVYNEVPNLADDSFSARVQKLTELIRPEDEIVLVDGGSTDFSWQAIARLANHPQIRAIPSNKGRARQMNAGAAQAKGDIFLFLHADTLLDGGAWQHFLALLPDAECRCVWGRFNVRIKGRSIWLPLVAWFMNHRSRLGKIGTGDQALFASRSLFQQIGGFPDQPLMEDIELCKRLKQTAAHEFLAIDTPVLTSGRRWDENGPWRTIFLMWRFRYQYWRGVPASELARQYADTREKQALTVAVFAKYPEPGRVKTRLAPVLGADQCAAFARYLLLSTLDKLQGANVVLWTDGGTPEQWEELLQGRNLIRKVQPDGHLGLRMQAAVDTHLKHSKVVVLLGPDAVEFSLSDLQKLQSLANQNQLAFLPAHDGGYVALACSHCVPAVFSESIAWGTSAVAEHTRQALMVCRVNAVWLEPQMDIDEPDDLQRAISLGHVPANWAERY